MIIFEGRFITQHCTKIKIVNRSCQAWFRHFVAT